MTDFGIARALEAQRGRDPDRHRARHLRLHLARAGPGPPRRRALRRLLARDRPLRAAHRRGAVHGRQLRRRRDAAHQRAAAARQPRSGPRCRAGSRPRSRRRSRRIPRGRFDDDGRLLRRARGLPRRGRAAATDTLGDRRPARSIAPRARRSRGARRRRWTRSSLARARPCSPVAAAVVVVVSARRRLGPAAAAALGRRSRSGLSAPTTRTATTSREHRARRATRPTATRRPSGRPSTTLPDRRARQAGRRDRPRRRRAGHGSQRSRSPRHARATRPIIRAGASAAGPVHRRLGARRPAAPTTTFTSTGTAARTT